MTVVHLWRKLDHSRFARLSARVDGDLGLGDDGQPVRQFDDHLSDPIKAGNLHYIFDRQRKDVAARVLSLGRYDGSIIPRQQVDVGNQQHQVRTLVLTEIVC